MLPPVFLDATGAELESVRSTRNGRERLVGRRDGRDRFTVPEKLGSVRGVAVVVVVFRMRVG